MKLHLYIDESGNFDDYVNDRVERRPSVVAGICSKYSAIEWRNALRNALSKANKEAGTSELTGAIHCSKIAGSRKKEQFLAVARKELLAHGEFAFGAVASTQYHTSLQHCYATCLFSAISTALAESKRRNILMDSLEIWVSSRRFGDNQEVDSRNRRDDVNIHTAMQHYLEYELRRDPDLWPFIKPIHGTDRLSYCVKPNESESALMAADVIAYCAFRGQRDGLILATAPRPQQDAPRETVARLRETRQVAAAVAFAAYQSTYAEFEASARMLPKIEDPQKRLSEAEAAWLLAERLISERQTTDKALDKAIFILTKLLEVCDQAPDSVNLRDRSRLKANALHGICIALNHKGDAHRQDEFAATLNKLLDEGLVERTASSRENKRLQFAVEQLNRPFNTYRFQESLSQAEALLRHRRSSNAGNPDEILGQILGSVGQAAAFMARVEKDLYEDFAVEHFEESLEHFIPGERFHQMSVNYLAAVACQACKPNEALKVMARHARPTRFTGEDLGRFLAAYPLAKDLYLFDLSNYLRIQTVLCDGGATTRPEAARALLSVLKKRLNNGKLAHPVEQVFRWIGRLLLASNDIQGAIEAFDLSLERCADTGFTIRTIHWPTFGLRAIARSMSKDEQGYAKDLAAFMREGAALMKEEDSFALYVNSVGGMAEAEKLVKERSLQAAATISRLLPFNYA